MADKLPIIDLEYRDPATSSKGDKMIDLEEVASIESRSGSCMVMKMKGGAFFEVPAALARVIAELWTKDREVIKISQDDKGNVKKS